MDESELKAFDVVVVGGGINGAGIARDAAGRGLKVLLCEQHDLAAHTSSSSTKLIHGGLRYLEFMEFNLVRKALAEREVLLAAAPHIMYPMRFVMPHESSLRPAWMIRIGLFLYDHLARRRSLPASSQIDLRRHAAGSALQEQFRKAFEYSDGWVDDARLVVLNALGAQELGADIRPRTRCRSISADGQGGWLVTLESCNGATTSVQARAVVNAAGPWAALFNSSGVPGAARHGLRLVKGSHIVVPKLFDHPYAYIFQATDRRVIFAIPYEENFTLIGTTDVEHHGSPAEAKISPEETRYLCDEVNRYFRKAITPNDVVHSYSGVRPLLEDESTDARAVSRDYALELTTTPAPLLSVFGGKITTFRVLAEEAVNRLCAALNVRHDPWTAAAPLPGGDLHNDDFDAFLAQLIAQHPRLPAPLLKRLARAYGSRVARVLGDAQTTADLGEEVCPGLFARELNYLISVEWAQTAEDILWRRSKLGLHLPADSATKIAHWLELHRRAA
ncbi:MAG: glycerol-3-phosphate dehydrogenase [Sinobacteraceae bacterium]|nr:glycerol-3-phosphate dehydrogenase [Nevskiaceae bacterium]